MRCGECSSQRPPGSASPPRRPWAVPRPGRGLPGCRRRFFADIDERDRSRSHPAHRRYVVSSARGGCAAGPLPVSCSSAGCGIMAAPGFMDRRPSRVPLRQPERCMGGSCEAVVPRLFLPATIPGGFAGLGPGPQGVRPNENVGRYRRPVDGTGDGRPSRKRIVGDVCASRTTGSDRCQEQQHRWESVPYDHPSGFSGTQAFRRPESFAPICWVGTYVASATRPVSRAPWPAISTSPATVQPRISAARFPCRSVQQFTQGFPTVGARSGTRGTRFPFGPGAPTCGACELQYVPT